MPKLSLRTTLALSFASISVLMSLLLSHSLERLANVPVGCLQSIVLMAGVAMAVLSALFGVLLAGRMARPMMQLSDAADRLRRGEDDAAIPTETAFRETWQLSSSFRRLIDTLRAEQTKLGVLNAALEEQVSARTLMLDTANRLLFDSLEERQQLVDRLKELANTDSLTQLLNRRAFQERADIEFKRLDRQSATLSVFIFDIDHFKRINDGYGHETGDEAIRMLARTAAGELREMDVLARFGGEEFVALLPDADLATAMEVAERLRAKITTLRIATPAGPIAMTASFGVAQWVPQVGIDTLIARADQALYGAKHTGRDRVVAWDE
ncbi:diguanylate cyclase [Chitinimonas arctica]|uniref:diguanylate cyclase n=1 Tax=Chitinimonas arctica TaxID=2594795 RepID=A0A516SCK2_9NEIS|nr:GGDEF domain-containing protein [Chitinimonas arctica]QDQ25872.1 diguanylate cyclase [Chitinimonas arctica]